jgi:predicted AlkP superfamily pyrophosphatase or phosphodiesterase
VKPIKVLCGAAVALATASQVAPIQAQPQTPKPKLVILLVIDQFRQEYLTRYAPYFGEGGFKYLQRSGANFQNARYEYGITYTGPGHACLASGTYGHTNGIIGNRWWNAQTKRTESMFFDANAQLIGLEASPKDDDTSPRNFIGNNIGDQLRLSNGLRSKVVGISNKDRAAIMLAGKLGRAYWFHEGAGGLTSSSYYGNALPAWVQNFNARRVPDSFFNRTWTKALPDNAYLTNRIDNFPAETEVKNLGRAFPHTLTDASGKPTTSFYEAFTGTPWANDYQFEVARAAIENEQLGTDEYPDMLGISITATDIAGHSWGPDSHEVQDIIVRLDRQLEGFIGAVNKRFKRNDVLWAITADHGACPLPEHMAAMGVDAGRVKKKQLNDAIVAALDARFGRPEGEAKWILALEDPGVFLNRDVVTQKKADWNEVQRVAGEATLTVPGIQAYYTREQLQDGRLSNKWAQMFERSFYAPRSGDVLLQTKPFYFWGSYGERDTGSTHGSPYDYDTHVPLIFVGPGVRTGNFAQDVEIVDLAPTLANLLGIQPPAGNEGRVLEEAFGK